MKTPIIQSLKKWQFILILFLLFSLGTFAATWHVFRLQAQLIESTSIQNARLLSDALTSFRTLYTSEVVNTAKQFGLEISHDYETKTHAIPLPATLSIMLGEKIGEQASGSNTMLYSPYPFPWRQKTGGLADPFKTDAWSFLTQNPDQTYYRVEVQHGQQHLRYATADLMRPACVQCHNNHPDTPKNDWQVGDVRGVLEVDIPLGQVTQQTQANLRETLTIFGTIALLAIIGIGAVYTKLRHLSDELQQRVETRTSELAHKAEMLERSNRELDQFAYVTSHDLKAPLRAISNLSHWIEEDIGEQLNEETHKQMSLLRGRVRRMEALIQGILAYSRVGRVAVEYEDVDVETLINETIETLDPPKGLSVKVGPDMPLLHTTVVQLSQVFANLISNAIKYHEKDHGLIQITVKDAGDFFQFSVIDDGPGIAAEFHGKVFQIFQTLQARDKVESTGVGLSLVKKIIEERGGEIGLLSSEGEGATFYFTWPKIETL